MTTRILKAPFPYMGGKSKIAAEVWRRFGDVPNYVEPFAGSCAILLGRPHAPKTETVNDLNGWLCNAWRAIARDPDAVAEYASDPVSELDLHARGDWLFYRPGVDKEFVEWLRADPDFYDAKSAGWWVWGQSSWIGDNWGRRECRSLPHLSREGKGVNRQLPHLANAGTGVNRKIPTLSHGNRGIERKRPHLATGGKGVARQIPLLTHGGNGINRQSDTTRKAEIREYMCQLAERFAKVRICCGDWSRVCGPSVTWARNGLTAVFLDPPYSATDRASVYGEYEDFNVAHAVREWAIKEGETPLMRIALCGYGGEHDMPRGWSEWQWHAGSGYSNRNSRGNENRKRETVWFSPHCQSGDDLFDFAESDRPKGSA